MTEYAVTIHIVTDVDIGLDMIEGVLDDAINRHESIYDCAERQGAEVEDWCITDSEVVE